ncbi:MAG: nucleoid-structuring protein H-NS [Halohasta sp.]
MTRSKGVEAERELSNWFEDERNYAAQRTASSGSATERARPDVIAAVKQPCPRRSSWETPRVLSKVYAIEVKAWSDATGHLDEHEVVELLEYAHRAGAEARVAVKPDLRSHDQWHVFEIADLNVTDGGNYSVTQSILPGMTLDEAFGPTR